MKIYFSFKRMLTLGIILLNVFFSYSQVLTGDYTARDTIGRSHNLRELIVRASGGTSREKLGRITVSGSEINRLPVILGEQDAIKALQYSSGVVGGTEGFAGLYVRGGENDQNLYLLDGLPLMNVYHFGGLFSTFNPQAISRLEFYKGVFPAVFSERGSSIVDIAAKKPSYVKKEGSFTIGLISGKIYFSTPVRKGTSGISLSLRRTWLDVFSAPALAILNAAKNADGEKKILNYNFTDAMVKFSHADQRSNSLDVVLFYGKDNFKLGNEYFNTLDKNEIFKKDINSMNWGNWGVSGNYAHDFSKWQVKVQPYVSKAFSSDTEFNFRETNPSDKLSSTTQVSPSVLQVGIRECVGFELLNSLRFVAGLQQSWYDYKIGNAYSRFSEGSQDESRFDLPDYSKNWILSAFGEIDWHLAALLRVTAGLRANNYLSSAMHHFNLEPRVSLEFGTGSESRLSLGYARLHQYSQQVSSNYIYLPTDAWLPAATYAAPLSSEIISAGIMKKFKDKCEVKCELWYKRMDNVADFRTNVSASTLNLPWNDKLTYGRGWAYGVDLEAAGSYGNFNWSVAYGLMWNWRKFAELNCGKRFPAKFDNRHKVSLGLSWNLNERMEFNGQWEYASGNLTTLALYNISPPNEAFPDSPFLNPLDPDNERHDGIEYLGKKNNVRLPSSHRLNINLTLSGRLNKKLTYQWNFGLYNAYCRFNPFTLVKSYVDTEWNNRGDYRKFKTLSLIPILPSVSYIVNF